MGPLQISSFILVFTILVIIALKCRHRCKSYRVEPAILPPPGPVSAAMEKIINHLEVIRKGENSFTIGSLVGAGLGSKDTCARYLVRLVDHGKVRMDSPKIVLPGAGSTAAKYSVV